MIKQNICRQLHPWAYLVEGHTTGYIYFQSPRLFLPLRCFCLWTRLNRISWNSLTVDSSTRYLITVSETNLHFDALIKIHRIGTATNHHDRSDFITISYSGHAAFVNQKWVDSSLLKWTSTEVSGLYVHIIQYRNQHLCARHVAEPAGSDLINANALKTNEVIAWNTHKKTNIHSYIVCP